MERLAQHRVQPRPRIPPREGLETERDESGRTLVRNTADHPLEYLFNRGLIDEAQWNAGDRFRTDWEHAEIGSARAIDLSSVPVQGGTRDHPSVAKLDALRRVSQALHSSEMGRFDRWILIEVVAMGRKIQDITAQQRWPRYHCTQRLREALEILVDWYQKADGHRRRS